MLVFCHCPKTAGTSVFRAISMAHGPRRSYHLKRGRPNVAELRARGIAFVAGHVAYGQYADQADAAGPDGLHFITFARDPVVVTLSLYRHCAQHRHIWRPAAQFFEADLPSRGIAMNTPQAVRLFLDRCHELTGIRWDNFQVRFAVNKPTGALDHADLAAAQHIFGVIDVVGITESFEASLRLIAMRFGWDSLAYGRYGTPPQATSPIFDADLLREIEARCALDRALVAWARDRFARDRSAACGSRLRLGAPAPKILHAAKPRRFGIRWLREWATLARSWTHDDWRWWCEIKAVVLRNRFWMHWRAVRRVRSVSDELRILGAVLADWRTGFVAKLCLIGGIALPFLPFDLIASRLPVVRRLDEAGYVVTGLLLARLLVPAESLPGPPKGDAPRDDGPEATGC